MVNADQVALGERYTISEAAKHLRWSVRTVRRLLALHGIATIGKGRLARLTANDIETLEKKERERCRSKSSASGEPSTSPASAREIPTSCGAAATMPSSRS